MLSVIKENPIVFLFSQMFKYSKGNRKQVSVFMIFFFISNSLVFLEPLLFAWLINVVQTEGVSQTNIWKLLGIVSLFIVLNFCFWIFHGIGRYLEIKNSFLVRAQYKEYLVKHVLELPATWHSSNQAGETMDKVSKSTEALFNFSNTSFIIFGAVMNLVAAFLAILFIDGSVALSLLIILGFVIFIIRWYDRRIVKNYKEIFKMENLLSAKIFDAFSNITSILILKIQSKFLTKIILAMKKPFELFRKNIVLNELKWFTVSMLCSLTIIFVLGTYFWNSQSTGSVVLIGTVSALFMYTQRINNFFTSFAAQYETMVRNKTSIENVRDIEQQFLTIKKKDQVYLPQKWSTLAFEHITFTYENKSAKRASSIFDISISVKAGERVAIIGESGSGKTTFLKVIAGLYEPNKGSINIDGKPVTDGLVRVENSSVLVPQEPELFAETIYENISLHDEHTLDEVKSFAQLSTFAPLIEDLEKGWHTELSQKGINLSGGQKQRLALARGLLAAKEKQLLFLDESTSSVDSTNEVQIYRNVFKHYKNKTIIATVHKLYLLPFFDTIYLFDKGKIVGSGTFEELLSSSAEFKKVWSNYKQSQAQ